tara:strand:- start:4299 stop:4724 length:426 start_codon:yes stop_codon:yes gene_type:complete
MSQLLKNAIRTPDGTVIESRSQHDYKSYKDANGKTYMVDGGLAYCRRSAHGDEIDLCIYDDGDHNARRHNLTWGSYGPKGDQPLKINTIAEMSTDHLQAVITTQTLSALYKETMQVELFNRHPQVAAGEISPANHSIGDVV